MGWFRDALGLPSREEARTLTSETLWGDSIPFNYVPGLEATPVSPAKALTLGPVYAAVRLLADSIATLPMDSFRKAGDERVPSSRLPALFESMKESGELVPWLYACVSSLATRGNAYGLIVARDGWQYPTIVTWLDPSVVVPDDRPNARGGWLVRGRPVPREDIIHITRFTQAGTRVGLSPIGAFAQSLGVALSAKDYTRTWFDNGGFPPGSFKNSQKTVTSSEAEIISSRLTNAIRGRRPIVYGSDWDYTPISVPQEEAQFLSTMKFTANDVAAIYGIMQPEWIGGESGSSNTYANVEQTQINFVMFTLRPWLVILEHAFSALIPVGQYVRFNSDALVRADLKTRWEVNQIRLTVGAASVDEIRAQEDEPPLPNGQGSKYAVPAAAPPAGAPPPASEQGTEQDQPSGEVTPIRRTA
jgi:HK97 family phage portal protein